MKKYMPLNGLRWSRDSGSTLCDTPQNGRSRTGWGGEVCMVLQKYVNLRHLNTKQSNINDKLLLMNIILRHTLLSASILSLMPIMANAQTDKDSVNYDLKLDTVHVTARRPIIKTEGSKDIVQVKGSYLGKLGNLGNMLVATPGISTV